LLTFNYYLHEQELQKPKMKPAEYREERAHRETEDAININEEQQQSPDNVFYEPPEWRNDNHQQQQHESSSSSLDNNEAPVPVTRTIRKTQANQEGEPQEQNPFSAIGPGPRKLYNPLDNEEHKVSISIMGNTINQIKSNKFYSANMVWSLRSILIMRSFTTTTMVMPSPLTDIVPGIISKTQEEKLTYSFNLIFL
jgi:hypothetical protein